MSAPRPIRFAPRVFPVESAADGGPLPTDRLLAALAPLRGLCVLDSAGGAPARWSVVGFEPLGLGDRGDASLEDLADLRARLGAIESRAGEAVPGPFRGGFLGALAYDIGVAGEGLELPRDPWCSPPIVGGLYTDFLVLDHARGRAWLVLGEEPGDGRGSVRARRAAVLDRLASVSAGGPGTPGEPRALGPLVRHVSSAEHGERIERVRAHIAAGDIYQANLAHRFTRRVAGHPVELYRRLRRVNPAPYMAYLAWDGSDAQPAGALLSASPELLLELADGAARTRPIKGTIERGETSADDALQRARLLASEKDLAELTMIVDLERNDLGRIAEVGTVRVEDFPALESYAAVHHLVADVTCRLKPGVDAVDVLAAIFPGGSITGAPKLRAMEVIRDLEGEGRGFFTGALGFLDTRGHAAFNILIRTLVWRPQPGEARSPDDGAGPDRAERAGEVSFHVGGGITFGSDAAAEERETLSKGAALAAALCDASERPETLGFDAPIRSA